MRMGFQVGPFIALEDRPRHRNRPKPSDRFVGFTLSLAALLGLMWMISWMISGTLGQALVAIPVTAVCALILIGQLFPTRGRGAGTPDPH